MSIGIYTYTSAPYNSLLSENCKLVPCIGSTDTRGHQSHQWQTLRRFHGAGGTRRLSLKECDFNLLFTRCNKDFRVVCDSIVQQNKYIVSKN